VTALRSAKRIELKDIEREKYFRLLARVEVDGKDLGKQLVATSLARPYDGGGKQGWC
jgi:micrococcal nuclease